MALDRTTVRNVVSLARLRVDEAALDGLADELSNIIGWVEALSEVDTEGVEPMTSVVPMTHRLREDVVTDGGIPDDVLTNAPERRDGFFAVPKVVE